MSENQFPAGWNDERVQRVLAHYEGQTEDAAVSEDEALMAGTETLVSVPFQLLPKVRELIAKHHKETED